MIIHVTSHEEWEEVHQSTLATLLMGGQYSFEDWRKYAGDVCEWCHHPLNQCTCPF